jgi:hypothetical protein
MRDDASLRRLAEMGVDVYAPRGASRATAEPAPAVVSAPAQPVPPIAGQGVLLLVGDVASPASALLADVARALRGAGIASSRANASDEAALAQAVALVVFGDAQARAAGALLPAHRQSEIGWVVTGEPAALSGDAIGKRALWSELKRMTRGIAVARHRIASA